MLEVEDTGPGILPQHEESFRTNIGAELSHVGCRVEMVANLEEARQHLHRRKFHLVLLDMRMPDGNGL